MGNNNNPLPRNIKIRASGMQFRLGHHTEYHRQLYTAIKNEDAAKLCLPEDVVKEWEKWLEIEIDINREAMASLYTQQMKEKDKLRSRLMLYIFKIVRDQRYSPVEVVTKAANALYVHIRPYFGTHKSNLLAKSAHIDGLLWDADKQPEDVKTLALKPALDLLRSTNKEYKELHSKRMDESRSKKLPRAKVVRRNIDIIFRNIISYIQAAYILATKEEDCRMIYNLSLFLNQTTADLCTSHNLSVAQRAAALRKRKEKKKEEEKKKAEAEKQKEQSAETSPIPPESKDQLSKPLTEEKKSSEAPIHPSPSHHDMKS